MADYEVTFESDPTVDVDFNIYDAYTTHNDLTGRDANNAHPISAITNLQSTLDAKESLSNKTTTVSSESTNTQYPSAKAVADYVVSNVTVRDVQVNGTTIVSEGTANIPIADALGQIGIVKPYGTSFAVNNLGQLTVKEPVAAAITNRYWNAPVTIHAMDDCLKAAMCDGVGAAWTATEQKAACDRMNAEYDGDYELIETITLSSASTSIIRNTEPSGTAYKFKKLMVCITTTATDANVTGAIRVKTDEYTNQYGAKVIQGTVASTAGGYSVMQAECKNGRLFGEGTCNFTTTDIESAAPSAVAAVPSRGLGAVGCLHGNYITWFHLYRDSGGAALPAGTVVEVYAIRA